jgi:hypothetical protein
MTLRSLILAASCLGAAAAWANGPLDPSLAPFARAARPMPDPLRVTFYQAFPLSDGRLLEHMGASGEVRQWFLWLRETLPAWARRRGQLDTHLGVYQDTVEEEGARVLKARQAATPARLTAFNARYDGRVMTLLHEYRAITARTPAAAAARRAARSEVAAALDEARAAALAVGVYEAEEEKAALLARRDAIFKHARGAAFIQDALEQAATLLAALKSPAALAAYAGEAAARTADQLMMDAVIGAEWVTLNQIDLREKTLNKALKAAKEETVRRRLTAADHRLDAARARLLEKSIEHTVLLADAWARIDQLAALERGGGGAGLFAALQSYNAGVGVMARTIRDGGLEYLFELERMPSAKAASLLRRIDEDIAEVRRRERGDFRSWLAVAGGTRAYVGSHAQWYGREHEEVERQVEAARTGAHLRLVQATVDQALLSLGDTVQP